jgi:hypothetical protein
MEIEVSSVFSPEKYLNSITPLTRLRQVMATAFDFFSPSIHYAFIIHFP